MGDLLDLPVTNWWFPAPGRARRALTSGRAERAGVTADGLGRDVWSDLVGGLLDARTDPATARFDAELAAAVAGGALTDEAAHRLRFWQRASVRALADHVSSVLPVALGALAAARKDAERYADEAAATLAAAAEPALADMDEAGVDVQVDLTRRASTRGTTEPRTLEADHPRLLVAELMTAKVRTDRTV
jgi:hypothetical protein